MKDYFTRENVILVLSFCFAAILYFSNNAYNNYKDVLNKYSIVTENLELEVNNLKQEVEISNFILDSLKPAMFERSKLTDDYLNALLKKQDSSARKIALKLKESVLKSLSSFSKFESIELTKKSLQTFKLNNDYLLSEKYIIDLMLEASIITDLSDQNLLLYKIQNHILELNGTGEKVISSILYGNSKSAENENILAKNKAKFEKSIQSLRSTLKLNFIMTGIFLVIWVNIFLLAIRHGIFRKNYKNSH